MTAFTVELRSLDANDYTHCPPATLLVISRVRRASVAGLSFAMPAAPSASVTIGAGPGPITATNPQR